MGAVARGRPEAGVETANEHNLPGQHVKQNEVALRRGYEVVKEMCNYLVHITAYK